AIARALALGGKTPREQAYLDALAAFYTDYDRLDHRTRATAYMRKMEELAQRHGDDVEARIFYALSLLATADGLDKTYKNQLKAGAILEQVFAEKPQHPGPSHYIIHAYDYPALVDRALAAAQNYAICVTVVPHAIHMPSHTYVLLGRWKDVITANDAAAGAGRGHEPAWGAAGRHRAQGRERLGRPRTRPRRRGGDTDAGGGRRGRDVGNPRHAEPRPDRHDRA